MDLSLGNIAGLVALTLRDPRGAARVMATDAGDPQEDFTEAVRLFFAGEPAASVSSRSGFVFTRTSSSQGSAASARSMMSAARQSSARPAVSTTSVR